MVGVQRGLLILVASGALAVTSHLNPGGVSPAKRDSGQKVTNVAYSVTEKEAYLAADQLGWIRPGLKFTIAGVTNVAASQKPIVEFYITDNMNQPIDRKGEVTPGVVSIRFTVATWDGHYYKNQIVVNGNPSRDTAGTFQDLEIGHYKYTFTNAMPSTFDSTKPATLFAGANRNMTDTLGKTYYINVFKDFVPSTGAAATTWGATTTAACQKCHDPLALHGGNYREAKTCALCHNPLNMTTASNKEFNGLSFWHRIHSNQDEEIGEITYPQLVQKCETCHDKAAPAGSVWYTYPSREACGGCHTYINWTTGEGHPAGAQADDSACATCHPPQGTAEWDASIKGAHTLPSDSTQLQGLVLTLVSITDTAPGAKPTVKFKLTDGKGNILKPTPAVSSLSLVLGGNTADYSLFPVISQSGLTAAHDPATGVNTYTFTTALPTSAKGTWTLSASARRTVTLNNADGTTRTYTEGAMNPILNFSVDGSAVVARRVAVDLAKCNACHYRLATTFSHGGQRIAIQFCVMCHNANSSDSSRRPADGSANPAESVQMARMIHRIHTGEELYQDYIVYGNAGTPNSFNEVTYPGDRRNCLACHTNTASYNLPAAKGALNVVTLRDYFTPQGPGTAACLGCHDNRDAVAHAYLMTSPFGESCGTCHGANADLSATQVHAR